MYIAYYIFPAWITKSRRLKGEAFGKVSSPIDGQSRLLDYQEGNGPIESIWLVPGTYKEN